MFAVAEKPPDVQENPYDYSVLDDPCSGGLETTLKKGKYAEATCIPDRNESLRPKSHVYEEDLSGHLYQSIELQLRPEEHVTNTAATKGTEGPIYDFVSLPEECPFGTPNQGCDC